MKQRDHKGLGSYTASASPTTPPPPQWHSATIPWHCSYCSAEMECEAASYATESRRFQCSVRRNCSAVVRTVASAGALASFPKGPRPFDCSTIQRTDDDAEQRSLSPNDVGHSRTIRRCPYKSAQTPTPENYYNSSINEVYNNNNNLKNSTVGE